MPDQKQIHKMHLTLTPEQLKALEAIRDVKGTLVDAELEGSNFSLSYVAMNRVLVKRSEKKA